MQNAEPSPKCLVSVCAACRMQDAGYAETRIGPKIDSSAWRAGCAGCRMQERCKIRPKEFVRRVQLTALSPIPHPASASCILHRVLRHPALGPILHSAFCICILHRVQCTALELILHSAFCICILHDVMLVPGHKRKRYGTIVTLERRLRMITS